MEAQVLEPPCKHVVKSRRVNVFNFCISTIIVTEFNFYGALPAGALFSFYKAERSVEKLGKVNKVFVMSQIGKDTILSMAILVTHACKINFSQLVVMIGDLHTVQEMTIPSRQRQP